MKGGICIAVMVKSLSGQYLNRHGIWTDRTPEQEVESEKMYKRASVSDFFLDPLVLKGLREDPFLHGGKKIFFRKIFNDDRSCSDWKSLVI